MIRSKSVALVFLLSVVLLATGSAAATAPAGVYRVSCRWPISTSRRRCAISHRFVRWAGWSPAGRFAKA